MWFLVGKKASILASVKKIFLEYSVVVIRASRTNSYHVSWDQDDLLMAPAEAATVIKIHKTLESTYAYRWELREFVWTNTIHEKCITIHIILNFLVSTFKKEKQTGKQVN